MWYAVETVFIDGELFDIHGFDYDKRHGITYAEHDEEPMNKTKRECSDRIEIHTDWFETKELAKGFIDGKITYVHYYDAYYDKSINSTLKKFSKRKIVKVDIDNGILPYKGIYKNVMLDYKPYWVR